MLDESVEGVLRIEENAPRYLVRAHVWVFRPLVFGFTVARNVACSEATDPPQLGTVCSQNFDNVGP